MVLYGINLFPLVEELRDANPTILSPFYADDVAFDGSERQSVNRGTDQGYFPDPAKSLFIPDNRRRRRQKRGSLRDKV